MRSCYDVTHLASCWSGSDTKWASSKYSIQFWVGAPAPCEPWIAWVASGWHALPFQKFGRRHTKENCRLIVPTAVSVYILDCFCNTGSILLNGGADCLASPRHNFGFLDLALSRLLVEWFASRLRWYILFSRAGTVRRTFTCQERWVSKKDMGWDAWQFNKVKRACD